MAELADTLAPTEADRLDQAEAWVRAYCRWHIAPERDEELHLDGPGGRVLVLPSLYVSAISEVTENGVILDPATDYEWSGSGYICRTGSTWASWENPQAYSTYRGVGWWATGPRSITVTLTHGYPDVPPDVTAVVQAVASRMAGNPSGLTQQTVGPFTEVYGSSLLGPLEAGVLSGYRLPSRP